MTAHQDGYAAGRADRLLQRISQYAWWGYECDEPNSYGHQYALGYRKGWDNSAPKRSAALPRQIERMQT